MLDASGSAIAEYEFDADTRMIDSESKVSSLTSFLVVFCLQNKFFFQVLLHGL